MKPVCVSHAIVVFIVVFDQQFLCCVCIMCNLLTIQSVLLGSARMPKYFICEQENTSLKNSLKQVKHKVQSFDDLWRLLWSESEHQHA